MTIQHNQGNAQQIVADMSDNFTFENVFLYKILYFEKFNLRPGQSTYGHAWCRLSLFFNIENLPVPNEVWRWRTLRQYAKEWKREIMMCHSTLKECVCRWNYLFCCAGLSWSNNVDSDLVCVQKVDCYLYSWLSPFVFLSIYRVWHKEGYR